MVDFFLINYDMMLQESSKGQIERLDEDMIKGYRFKDNLHYAFIDVYWQKVSDHYLIQTREKFKRHSWGEKSSGPKPIYGPFPIEILKPETSEEIADQRCLEILRKIIKTQGLDKILEHSSAND